MNYLLVLFSLLFLLVSQASAQKLQWESLKGINSTFVNDNFVGGDFPGGIDQDSSGTLWLCAHEAVYRSNDMGATWSVLHRPGTHQMVRGFTVNGKYLVFVEQQGLVHWTEEFGMFTTGGPDDFSVFGPSKYGLYFWGSKTRGVFRSRFPNILNYTLEDSSFNAPVYTIANGTGATLYAGTPGKLYRTIDTGRTWHHYGPALDSTIIITAIVELEGSVMVGTSQNGIFQLIDGEWRHLTGNTRPFKIEALASVDRKRIIASAGSDGVYEWNSARQLWAQLDQGLPSTHAKKLITAIDGSYLLMTANGVFRLTPDGSEWVPIGLPMPIITGFETSKNGMLYVQTHTGFYRSSDNGNSWLDIMHDGTSFAAYSMTELSDGTLVAATSRGLFRSTNDGGVWTQNNKYLAGSGSQHSALVSIDSNTIVAMGGEQTAMHRSTTRGVTWRPVYGGLPFGSSIVRKSGTTILASNGQAMYRSINGGMTWEKVHPIPDQSYRIIKDILFLNKNEVLMNRTDSGFIYSSDAGITWTQQSASLRKIRDGGANLRLQGTDILASSYFGVLYRSVDKGKTWDSIAQLPGKNAGVFLNSGDYILQAIGDELHRSSDNGHSWIKLTDIYSQVTSIDTTAAGHIYLSTVRSGLLRSTDRGLTWHMRSRGIRSQPSAWHGFLQPIAAYPNGVLLITDLGDLYRSTDDGVSWTRPDSSLRLYSSYDHQRFDVAPDGRLIWQLVRNGNLRTLHSLDSGISWFIPSGHDSSYYLTRIVFDGSSRAIGHVTNNAAYARIYQLENDHSPWIQIDSFVYEDYVKSVDLAVGPSGNLYSTLSYRTDLETDDFVFQVSEDRKTFETRSKGLSSPLFIAVDRFENIYAVNGSYYETESASPYNIYMSKDIGRKWSKTHDGVFSYVRPHALAVNRQYLFAATTGGGIFRALIPGASSVSREEGSSSSVHVFPNPVTRFVRIETSSSCNGPVHLYNAQGIRIMESSFEQGSAVFDLHTLPAGGYFYRFIESDRIASGKFIKVD